MPSLNTLITRVRRNHGLEHATVHILQERLGHIAVVGRSDWHGFTLYGPLETTDVSQAAAEALQRLRRGEAELAIHPRCGTGIVATGLLTTLAAFLAMALESGPSRRFRWSSFPAALLAATAAVILAQPLGLVLQEKFTTDGNPGGLEIKTVSRQAAGGITAHRVETVQ